MKSQDNDRGGGDNRADHPAEQLDETTLHQTASRGDPKTAEDGREDRCVPGSNQESSSTGAKDSGTSGEQSAEEEARDIKRLRELFEAARKRVESMTDEEKDAAFPEFSESAPGSSRDPMSPDRRPTLTARGRRTQPATHGRIHCNGGSRAD